MSECILKLYEANQKLLSNQQSMFETNKVLITKLMKYEPIDASIQKRFNEYAGRGKKDDAGTACGNGACEAQLPIRG